MRSFVPILLLVVAIPAGADEVEERCDQLGKAYGQYIQGNFDGKPMEDFIEATREMPEDVGRVHRQLIRAAYSLPRVQTERAQEQMKRTSVLMAKNECIRKVRESRR